MPIHALVLSDKIRIKFGFCHNTGFKKLKTCMPCIACHSPVVCYFTGLEVIFFSCLTRLNMKFQLFIKTEMFKK